MGHLLVHYIAKEEASCLSVQTQEKGKSNISNREECLTLSTEQAGDSRADHDFSEKVEST